MSTAYGSPARAHGLLIKEGFTDGEYPDPVRKYVTREYPYLLSREHPVTIAVVDVPAGDVVSLIAPLSEALLPERFYAHFVVGTRLVVVFPMSVAFVKRGDEDSAEVAKRIGRLFKIPDAQMRFSELFTEDHPGGE